MRVGVAQMPISGDLGVNLDYIANRIAQASEAGADVLLCPETALTGYLGISRTELPSLPPEDVHDSIEKLRSVCRTHSCALVVGQYFKRCGLWYNNAVVIDRAGRVVASYDKAHLVDLDCYEVAPGRTRAIFELDGIKSSLAICHDIRYPDLLADYGDQSVQVHFHLFYGLRSPSNLSAHDEYDALLRVRASENGFYIVAANVAENEQMVRSQVVDPFGQRLAKAQSWTEEVIICDIDPEKSGDSWNRKRRFDLPRSSTGSNQQSFFEQGVWERKPYMIKHDRSLKSDAPV